MVQKVNYYILELYTVNIIGNFNLNRKRIDNHLYQYIKLLNCIYFKNEYNCSYNYNEIEVLKLSANDINKPL